MLQYDVVLTSIGIAFVAVNHCLAVGTKATRGYNIRLMQEQGKLNVDFWTKVWKRSRHPGWNQFLLPLGGYYTRSDQRSAGNGCGDQGGLAVLPLRDRVHATLVVGGLRVMDGALSIGMLVAFQALMQSLWSLLTISSAWVISKVEGQSESSR